MFRGFLLGDNRFSLGIVIERAGVSVERAISQLPLTILRYFQDILEKLGVLCFPFALISHLSHLLHESSVIAVWDRQCLEIAFALEVLFCCLLKKHYRHRHCLSFLHVSGYRLRAVWGVRRASGEWRSREDFPLVSNPILHNLFIPLVRRI